MSRAERCFGDGDPIMERYHDEEWGFPCADEPAQYELLTLEAFQSGLSWRTILHKREAFRAAFAGFDPDRVATFDQTDVQRLLSEPGIVRNRAKIEAAIANAAAVVRLRTSGEPLTTVTRGHIVTRRRRAPVSWADVPSASQEAVSLARELKGRGFRFLGPTTVYAFMQACGLVNDHLAGCPWRPVAERARSAAGLTHGGAGPVT